MSADTNAPAEAGETHEFGRGYYLFFGAVAGFFVVVALALTVIIGWPVVVDLFSSDVAAAPSDDGGAGPVDPTSPDEGGDGAVAAGDPAAGEELFSGTCAACHGGNAEGVTGLGPALVGNEFVAGQTDEDLVAFIEVGRPGDDPDNITGIAMPPKGGNPSLSSSDLTDVVAFLRTLE